MSEAQSRTPEGRRSAYEEALRATHREALATLAAALLTFLYFWGAVALFKDSGVSVAGFPLWFAAAVIGGYLFSIGAVLFLVKRVFRDVSLHLTPDEDEL